jgi:hypothetical protein
MGLRRECRARWFAYNGLSEAYAQAFRDVSGAAQAELVKPTYHSGVGVSETATRRNWNRHRLDCGG